MPSCDGGQSSWHHVRVRSSGLFSSAAAAAAALLHHLLHHLLHLFHYFLDGRRHHTHHWRGWRSGWGWLGLSLYLGGKQDQSDGQGDQTEHREFVHLAIWNGIDSLFLNDYRRWESIDQDVCEPETSDHLLYTIETWIESSIGIKMKAWRLFSLLQCHNRIIFDMSANRQVIVYQSVLPDIKLQLALLSNKTLKPVVIINIFTIWNTFDHQGSPKSWLFAL